MLLEPNTTYTLSGMVKTDLSNGADFFNVQSLNEHGAGIDGGWHDTRHNKVQGTRDWVNRQVTFKTTEQTRKVKIYLQVENGGSSTSGSVWFDKLQLEKGEVSSSFNPITNSSVENVTEQGCIPGWIRGDGTSCDPKDVSHQESFTGDSSIVLERSQYGGSNVGYGNHVNLNQKKAEPITLTGMSKSENVENDASDKLSRDYSVWADVHYQDGSGENYQAKFPSGTNDWNRSAVVIPAKKPIKQIQVYLLFRNNNKGKVWFDDIRLLEGNALIKNEYDNDGDVVATYDEEGQKNTFTYDASGNKKSETDEKGNTKLYDYNKDNLLTKVTSNSILLSERYEYDQAGNRTKIKYEGAGGKVTETNFVYDPIHQLLQETLPNGTSKSYTYDGFGNRTSVKVVENGKETKSVAATFNEGNQLVKFVNESLTYDANGNRTSDGKYKYTWNEDDQIIAITKQGESNAFATYKYDEDNRRIEKNVNGQVTRYFYDGDSINPLYETDGSGNVLRQYVYSTSGVRLAMKSKGQTLYYHYNPRGDVVAMTNQDKEVVATYEYDSWGNVLKSDTKGIAADNPFGYAGYMYDKEIGMYYLIARYYNPEHGVFLSVDPDPGDEDDPITMNGYTYGDNNPVMMVDPDGHAAWWLVSGGVGAVVNGGSYLISHYKKNKSLKGINKWAFAKTTARGFVGGVIGGTGGRLAKAATLGRKSKAFLSLHTGVAGYAVANSSRDYSGKGLGRDLAYSMTGNKGYIGLNFATTYYENSSKKKSKPKKKQISKKRKR
ncbi:RHS repeat-associated protein [Bacillus sp. RC51]